MPKISFSAHPHLLGFERLDKMLELSAKSNGDGFPPYNIEQSSDDDFRISLAVAGFAMGDLDVVVEGAQLVVRGEQGARSTQAEYLHQGIAARQFKRIFVLADGIDVVGATLENGLLHLDLKRCDREEIVQNIAIS